METLANIIEVTRILDGSRRIKLYVNVLSIIGISELMNGGDYFDVFFEDYVWKVASEDYETLLNTWMGFNKSYKTQ